jgi:hypothetical protein
MPLEQVDREIAITKRGLKEAGQSIVRQVAGRAWLAKGFADWEEMREAVYSGPVVIVPRADRPELVALLRREGLSQKQIGDTLGVSEGTVNADVRNLRTEDTEPTTRTDSLGRERPTSYERPEPSQAVTDFLDSDEDLQRARYLASFLKVLTRSDDFMEFDPEKVGGLLDPDDISLIDGYLTRVSNFVKRVHQAHRGLHLVKEAPNA